MTCNSQYSFVIYVKLPISNLFERRLGYAFASGRYRNRLQTEAWFKQ